MAEEAAVVARQPTGRPPTLYRIESIRRARSPQRPRTCRGPGLGGCDICRWKSLVPLLPPSLPPSLSLCLREAVRGSANLLHLVLLSSGKYLFPFESLANHCQRCTFPVPNHQKQGEQGGRGEKKRHAPIKGSMGLSGSPLQSTSSSLSLASQ